MAEGREHEFLLKQMAASIASGMCMNRDKVMQLPDETKDEAITRKASEMALSIDKMVDRKLITRRFSKALGVRDYLYPEHEGHDIRDVRTSRNGCDVLCFCGETLNITDKQYNTYLYRGGFRECSLCGNKMRSTPHSSCGKCGWTIPV